MKNSFIIFFLLFFVCAFKGEAQPFYDFLFEDNSLPTSSNKNELSKEDVLGVNFYKPVSSKLIQNQVNSHLNAISQICSLKIPLSEKASKLETTFEGIRNTARKYLDTHYLQSDDRLLLRGLEYNLRRDRLTYGKPVTEELIRSSDLILSFQLNYRMDYNLPTNTSPKDYPDEWAQKINKGLECLDENSGP